MGRIPKAEKERALMTLTNPNQGDYNEIHAILCLKSNIV